MYRAALEFIMGFKLSGESLILDPCIPRAWREFEMTYLKGTTTYHIRVENAEGVNQGVVKVTLDGEPRTAREIHLIDDGGRHQIHLVLGVQAQVSTSLASTSIKVPV
jgi:cellobiose phosphorylase